MCWRVKEGEYEAPNLDSGKSLFSDFRAYFRDCLSVPIYRHFFLVYVLFMIASTSAASSFSLYARYTLHMEMGAMGSIYTYAAILSALIYAPMGRLIEKATALRVTLASLIVLVAVSYLSFFLVGSPRSWLVYSLIFALPQVGWGLGSLAFTMQLFPKESFGQFFSGLNVFACGALIVGNYVIGEFMDLSGSRYQLVFLWSSFFYALALLPMLRVRREWIHYGGPNTYVPPLPSSER